ncbi:MAG: LysR family transcriptional regulator [Terrisporobacter sp.]
MTIRHLKIFVTVIDCKTMRKASEKLYISQPAVSQAISELEKYYGIKVFERLSQRLYITEEGKLLLSSARYIIDSFEKMEEEILDASLKLQIRIGGSVSIGTNLLIDLINKLEEQVPGIDVRVTINNTSKIEEMICNNDLDIAIVEGLVKSNEIIQQPVNDDELVIIVGKSHQFWDEKEINLSQLENRVVISREQGSSDRNQFEQFLSEHNVNVNKKWYCTNTEAIKNIVIAGKGMAIISKMLVEKEIKDNTLRVLPIKDIKIERQNKLIYHKNKYISPQMKEFMDICLNKKYHDVIL